MASDNFTRGDSGTLGANWTKLSSFSDLRITSNKALASVASPDCVDAWTANGVFPANMWSEVTIGTFLADGGPTVRSDTAGTFYLLDCGASANVFKCIATVFSQIDSSGATFANGDVARITVTGTSIVTTQNGTTRNNFTDSAIDGTTTGGLYPGLHASNTNITYASWQAPAIGPTINTQPTNQTAYAGQIATFNVTATASSGALSYQWVKNGSNVGTNSNSYTTGTLTLADNASTVRCDVTDDNGTTSSQTVYLFVWPTSSVAWIHI